LAYTVDGWVVPNYILVQPPPHTHTRARADDSIPGWLFTWVVSFGIKGHTLYYEMITYKYMLIKHTAILEGKIITGMV